MLSRCFYIVSPLKHFSGVNCSLLRLFHSDVIFPVSGSSVFIFPLRFEITPTPPVGPTTSKAHVFSFLGGLCPNSPAFFFSLLTDRVPQCYSVYPPCTVLGLFLAALPFLLRGKRALSVISPRLFSSFFPSLVLGDVFFFFLLPYLRQQTQDHKTALTS